MYTKQTSLEGTSLLRAKLVSTNNINASQNSLWKAIVVL